MSLDQTWELRLQKAVDGFNESPATRTVSGLMRTLGRPRVSIGAAAGSPSEVRITVAWELSWYQWGIDVADEALPVAVLGNGGELTDLDGSARFWNGGAAPSGRLYLGNVEPVPLSRAARLRRALT